jgi:hypothetical protein
MVKKNINWRIIALIILIFGWVVAKAHHDKWYYSRDNPSRKLISLISTKLRAHGNAIEVHEDISHSVEKIIPLGSGKENALKILHDANFEIQEIFNPQFGPKNCAELEVDEIYLGKRWQALFLGASGSKITLCIQNNKLIGLRAWLKRDAL